MDQDRLLEMFEFSEGNIRCPDRSPALPAHDAEANVRLLDHGHVIAPVTNGCSHRAARGALDKFDDLGLLQRRQAAADHTIAASAQLEMAT